jgi:hypothetical protein
VRGKHVGELSVRMLRQVTPGAHLEARGRAAGGRRDRALVLDGCAIAPRQLQKLAALEAEAKQLRAMLAESVRAARRNSQREPGTRRSER